jgi:hypothetical protein
MAFQEATGRLEDGKNVVIGHRCLLSLSKLVSPVLRVAGPVHEATGAR